MGAAAAGFAAAVAFWAGVDAGAAAAGAAKLRGLGAEGFEDALGIAGFGQIGRGVAARAKGAGAAVIVAMQNYLVTLGDKIIAIQGIIFMLAVLLFREGVVGLLARWLKKPL